MEPILKTATQLKGKLLLSVEGKIYLLKDFTYKEEEITISSWLWGKFKDTQKWISKLQFSNREEEFAFADKSRLVATLNHAVDDRKRYITLQHSLAQMGAAITTNKLINVNKIKNSQS